MRNMKVDIHPEKKYKKIESSDHLLTNYEINHVRQLNNFTGDIQNTLSIKILETPIKYHTQI